MLPKKKGSEVKTWEPENTIVMNVRIKIVEGELERMTTIMEEIRLQVVQNQSVIETMPKEVVVN